MLALHSREARHQRRLTRCLWWWSVTLAGSNVAHYLGENVLGYGVALAVHLGLGVYGALQLWRSR